MKYDIQSRHSRCCALSRPRAAALTVGRLRVECWGNSLRAASGRPSESCRARNSRFTSGLTSRWEGSMVVGPTQGEAGKQVRLSSRCPLSRARRGMTVERWLIAQRINATRWLATGRAARESLVSVEPCIYRAAAGRDEHLVQGVDYVGRHRLQASTGQISCGLLSLSARPVDLVDALCCIRIECSVACIADRQRRDRLKARASQHARGLMRPNPALRPGEM